MEKAGEEHRDGAAVLEPDVGPRMETSPGPGGRTEGGSSEDM